MSLQDSTTETPEDQNKSEPIGNLLNRAIWPLDGFLKELQSMSSQGVDIYDELLHFLVPVMECVEKNLEIVAGVLEDSMGGRIMVEHTMFRVFGGFNRDDFGKAFIKQESAARQPGA
jgi:hypothetical protein